MNHQPIDVAKHAHSDEASLRLAAIVESSDDAIVSKNLDGVVTSWNPAAERMFGYAADEMIGRSIRTIIPPDRQSEEDEVLKRLRSGERIDHFETVRCRKDGTELAISLTVSPIQDETGRIIGASKIARDISERVKAQEAIARSMALKDQFLGLVSHELRTPISTIVANSLVLLRRTDLPAEPRQQALQDIAAEAEKLQRVIENLLLLTQVESLEQLSRKRVAVDELVSAHVTTLARRTGRRIQLLKEGALKQVDAEPTLLAIVVENLLSNADKYSPPDAPIDIVLGTSEAGEFELRVRDRGIGIDESELADLFTPFYRTESARQRAGGMGLGLALSKRIVEAHRGRIWAAPSPAGGAEFVVVLPVTRHEDYPEVA